MDMSPLFPLILLFFFPIPLLTTYIELYLIIMDPFGVLEALIGTFFVILLLNDGDSEDPRQASVVIITFINTHEY